MAGLLRVVSNNQLDKAQRDQDELKQAREAQGETMIVELAGYIRQCYSASRDDRNNTSVTTSLNERMLQSLRQRLGQYEPEMLQSLVEQGGTQVYMLLTQTKCRGAEAWLRDVMLSTGMIPWDMSPTPVPELSPEEIQHVMQQIGEQVAQLVQTQGIVPTQDELEEVKELAMRKVKTMRMDEATQACAGMKAEIADQLQQGNLVAAVDAFISDLTTYPFAVLKGPVITTRSFLTWERDPETQKFTSVVGQKPAPWFSRVSPFDFYWEPGITDIQNGYVIERHELSRRDVADMLGQPGYDDGAVKLVLHDYEDGMLNDWLDVDYREQERRRLENRNGLFLANTSPAPVFKALEFSGSVSGKMLIEWGRTDIEDENKEYEINAWLIGRHVVRAVLNADPLFEKPYRVATFNRVPGSVAGMSLPELIADTQAICNAAARAIVNNMSIASGPQVELNMDRLPAGEKPTEMFPWKIWQTLNDPLGTSAPAVRFNQPTDNTAALMQVFDKFSRQADEQSGIPAYTYGDTDIQGAGRTASGLSMLMGSAGKGIRQIITGIDLDVFVRALRQLYRWNMKFSEDESIKGDADVVMKGTASLVKEQLNLRRNEFLQATANPIDAEIVGVKGRAAILREVAKGLEMDVDKIIPSEMELELLDKFKRQVMQAQAQSEQASAQPQPQQDQVSIQKSADGGQKTTVKGTNLVNRRPSGAMMDQGATPRTAK